MSAEIMARHKGLDPLCRRRQRRRELSAEQLEVLLLRGDARVMHGKYGRAVYVWNSECRWLPGKQVRALDAMPRVRGRTWRDMPRGNPECDETQAMNWWLFCRGDLSVAYKGGTAEQRAARDAMLAIAAAEKAEARPEPPKGGTTMLEAEGRIAA